MDRNELFTLTERIFTAKRKYYYRQQLLDFRAPMMANTLQISMVLDQQYLQPMILAMCSTLEGETTEETRTEEFTFDFSVFKSWTDHLKYRLNRRFRLNFRVEYITVTKKIPKELKVKVVRTCPHHDSNYGDAPVVHLRYMFPSQINQI